MVREAGRRSGQIRAGRGQGGGQEERSDKGEAWSGRYTRGAVRCLTSWCYYLIISQYLTLRQGQSLLQAIVVWGLSAVGKPYTFLKPYTFHC